VILGSSSPRRRDLLAAVGLQFTVVRPGTEEKVRPGEGPEDYVRRNAREKGAWVAEHASKEQHPHGFIVISADTIVVIGGLVLEKPVDRDDAVRMLGRLSGRTHEVMTGVTIQAGGAAPAQPVTFAVHTRVRIKTLSPHEIDAYVRTGEPLDKAGAYAAQGIGSYMVESIEGSYTNVVGLPVSQVVECLEHTFAYPLWEA
jgi:septum formation protein